MTIRRIVPNILSKNPKQSQGFYADFLNMEVTMARDEIISFASPANSTAQLSIIRDEESYAPQPNVSIEVSDVDEIYAKAIARGIEIVYPLTDEPWGVRRFFVIDPNGAIINILSHL